MNDQRIVLFLLLCFTAGSNSQGSLCNDPKQQLMNVVVFEGQPSSFYNQIDQQQVTWMIAPSHDPEAINGGSPTPPYTVADNGITPYPGVYTVTPTQLSIPMSSINPQFNDSYSTSGFYTLTYKSDGCQAMANLIVISKGPDCQCNMVDSDNADLTCLIEYGVTRLLPNRATMTWTTDSGDKVLTETNESNKDNPTYDISTSVYQVKSSGAATYTCTVTFTTPESSNPNMATNAPTVNASCTVANCAKATTTATTTEVSSTATSTNCSKDLINIVVYEGSEAVFENLDDGKPVKWHFSSSSDPESNLLDVTNYDFKVNPMFVGAYNVTKTKLTILNATVVPSGRNPYATAGVYFLTYQSTGCQTAANLIVIQGGPVCNRNENDPNNIIMSCNISYAESGRQPSYPTMTWTTGSGVIQSDNPTTQKTRYVYESLSQISVNNTAPSYYKCQVTFNVPASYPVSFLAQNAPSYTESCTVSPGTFPPTTGIATTTAGTFAPITEIATTTAGTFPPITEIATTTAGTFPPTTEISTTTVDANRPNCSSNWLSNQTTFCRYVQEFRNDCPEFCKGF